MATWILTSLKGMTILGLSGLGSNSRCTQHSPELLNWNLTTGCSLVLNPDTSFSELCVGGGHTLLQRMQSVYSKSNQFSGHAQSSNVNKLIISRNNYMALNNYSYLIIVEKRKNLVFCFGTQFNSTLNFTQSGWLIPFSPDLLFRLANGWAAKHTLFSLRRRPEQTCLWSSLLSDAF